MAEISTVEIQVFAGCNFSNLIKEGVNNGCALEPSRIMDATGAAKRLSGRHARPSRDSMSPAMSRFIIASLATLLSNGLSNHLFFRLLSALRGLMSAA